MITGKNIKIKYGDRVILDDIDFEINKGINGFLGANGVGKTTLFKLIIGELKPFSGEIKIAGADRDIIIGYLPQNFKGYPEMSVKEFLYYIAELKMELKKIKKSVIKKEVEDKIEIFSLNGLEKVKLKKLSGGQLRRVGLAQATLFDPFIIILDEPTTGLDPKERVKFRRYLTSLSENSIVLLSTHIVSDLQDSSNKIFILKDGKIIIQGEENDILDKYPMKAYKYYAKDINSAENIDSKFLVSNMHKCDAGYELRIISNNKPLDDAVEDRLKLEDIYYVNFSEDVENEI